MQTEHPFFPRLLVRPDKLKNEHISTSTVWTASLKWLLNLAT